MSSDLQKRGNNPMAIVKNYLSEDHIKKRFEEMLGDRAAGFITSIVNVVGGSTQLQQCDPDSIMASSMVSASVNLPIDPALGMAAIVPYGKKAQFQIMWRGVVQLCLRTQQYADIQCTEIYRDELKSHNPITGSIAFHPPDQYKLRYSDSKLGDVVGYYAMFRLKSGFEKAIYMSQGEVMAHAKRYSKAYQYDLSKGKKTSAWSTDPIAMGRKTVLLRLLGRWGIKSIEIEKVIVGERDDFKSALLDAAARLAAETGTKPIDTEFEKPKQTRKRNKKKVESTQQATETPTQDAEEPPPPKSAYKCKSSKCQNEFDEPELAGDGTLLCPRCLTADIEKAA